ncbi:sigma-70 family RNA polymerase sigma factor [Paenibacillus sp. MZ04-78.2]|uniref:sigma-70 family RNA polymerase sigma factor n=1 Tax=Paenibacillus sp. MZ04-78.2 TaxID=2962034 RepID=UPI0020B6DA1F|nr:sigma-70 family RNA polymerase sigma factor [Paenibacillus sp. MZ04-78.2]MCP3775624.1 sigma-70 family RNA polymerase sigma factor [Paenibacillus sp. MZ04-78.2]
MDNEQLNVWLDRLIDGNPDAFEVIYGMTKNKVYATVAALVAHPADVNDIVSEIYYQLWRALPSYDRTRPFLFWLNGIVLRQISSWRRQLWRRFRLLEKKNRLSVEPHVERPEEPLLENESQREMQRLINQLPFKLRIVIIYRFYYDFSQEQVAELLQIPLGTVKSRNHLALKQLRQWLDTQANKEASSEHVNLGRN